MTAKTELRRRSATPTSLYEQDFLAWTLEQAAFLRSHDFANADIERIAEEIEDLGRSSRLALSSQLRRVIIHLMKLQASPAADPRAGWRGTIAAARAEIDALLTANPSLRREIPSLVQAEIIRARRVAAAELADHAENPAGLETLTYTPDQILGTWLPGTAP